VSCIGMQVWDRIAIRGEGSENGTEITFIIPTSNLNLI
jgi:hypothetical protein